MTLFEIMKDINSVNESKRLNYALSKYSIYFNEDIVKYFFVKHCSAVNNIFFKFLDVDLLTYRAEECYVSTIEVFEIIDYAPTCNLKDESNECYSQLDLPNKLIAEGTWCAPIIVMLYDKRYIVLDGNNRLRILRMHLKYSKEYKSSKHKIYLLTKNDSDCTSKDDISTFNS